MSSRNKILAISVGVIILVGAIVCGVLLYNQSRMNRPIYKDLRAVYDKILLDNKGSRGEYFRSECRDMQFVKGLDHSETACGPTGRITLSNYLTSPQSEEFIRDTLKPNPKFSDLANGGIQGNVSGHGYSARFSFNYESSNCLAYVSAGIEKKVTEMTFLCTE